MAGSRPPSAEKAVESIVRTTADHASRLAGAAVDTGARAARAGADAMREGLDQAAHSSAQIARAAADQTQQAVEHARQAGNAAADEMAFRTEGGIARSLGFAEQQFKQMMQQYTQGVDAMLRSSAIVAGGVQSISREWLDLAGTRMDRNTDRVRQLFQVRTPEDLFSGQLALMRDCLEELMRASARVAELSSRTANDAARALGAMPS